MIEGSDIQPLARLPQEWQEVMVARGEAGYRGGQVFRWIHARGVTDPAAMTDLSKVLRQGLAAEGLAAAMELERCHHSADGSRKLLLRMADGAAVEAVLLPVSNPAIRDGDADAAAVVEVDDDDDTPQVARVTQCISTQVGCALGCAFCASGVAGLKRHMTAAEIVSQILIGRGSLEATEKLRNVVLMGMGEPLHNYDATARALRLIAHPEGIAIPLRRVTVSTSGLVPQIDRLAEDFEGKVGLAISLHAADNETRSSLMPINKRYPLAELIAALRRYPLRRGRRITIEHTLIRGRNDGKDHARALAKLLRGLRVKINLIPMNPIATSELRPPDDDAVHAFQQLLTTAGYLCFVRRRRGDDVAAACGQLALNRQ